MITVGDIRRAIEFVDDDTKVYVESLISGEFTPVQGAQLEFLVEADNPSNRLLAYPEDSIDNEIGLVIW